MTASSSMPSFATHYYLGSRRPFLKVESVLVVEIC
jgi:hypothetical protein